MDAFLIPINDELHFFLDGYARQLYSEQPDLDPVQLSNLANEKARELGYDPNALITRNFPNVPFDLAGRYAAKKLLPWEQLVRMIGNPANARTQYNYITDTHDKAWATEKFLFACKILLPNLDLSPEPGRTELPFRIPNGGEVYTPPSAQIQDIVRSIANKVKEPITTKYSYDRLHPLFWPYLETLGYSLRNREEHDYTDLDSPQVWEYTIPDQVKQYLTREAITSLLHEVGIPMLKRNKWDEDVIGEAIPVIYLSDLITRKAKLPEDAPEILTKTISTSVHRALRINYLSSSRSAHIKRFVYPPELADLQEAHAERLWYVDYYRINKTSPDYNELVNINGVQAQLMGVACDGRTLIYLHCVSNYRSLQAIKRSIVNGKISAIKYWGLEKRPQKEMSVKINKLPGGYELIAIHPSADNRPNGHTYLLSHEIAAVKHAFDHAMLTSCEYPIRNEWLDTIYEDAITNDVLREVRSNGVLCYRFNPNSPSIQQIIKNRVKNKTLAMPEPLKEEIEETNDAP